MAVITIVTLPARARQSTAQAPDIFETPQALTTGTIPADSYVMIRTQIDQADLLDVAKSLRLRFFTSPEAVTWSQRDPFGLGGITHVRFPDHN